MEKQFSRDEINRALQDTGFLVLNLSSLDTYYQVCEQLGEIKHKLEVKLVPGSKIYANIKCRVPFHTDNPNIPIVAWHCLEQDSTNGANLLIDSHLVIQKLSEEDIITLAGIRLPVPYSESKHAILDFSPYHIYWLPRMVEETKSTFSEKELGAIKRFHAALEQVHKSTQHQKVRLQKGDTLFVNNWVMLHGRDEIYGDSKRHLVRVYIGGDVDFRAH